MAGVFILEKHLATAELEELKGFLREKRRSVTDTHEWVLSRHPEWRPPQPEGAFVLHRSAVGTWKADFDGEEAAELSRASNTIVAKLNAVSKEGGVGLQSAVIMQLSHSLSMALAEMQASGEYDIKALNSAALAMQRVAYSTMRIEDVRAELENKQAKALAEAEKVAASGADGRSVVSKMREYLNLPPLPPPVGGAA